MKPSMMPTTTASSKKPTMIEQIDRYEKELKEQETLLAGYQQENKKLYEQLKGGQKQSKHAEERMFKENQKLAMEVATLRYSF